MNHIDSPYYKKTVTLNIGDRDLLFDVSQTLFSSHAIDTGTDFLLRTLRGTTCQFRKVLDLGCGYGAIGIALKHLNPSIVLHMVDRDALAVTYAAQNALLNGVDEVFTYGSIGFDDVADTDFDLIAANIPGKAGESVIASWLLESPLFLRRQGHVGVVVVSPLESLVSEVIGEIPAAELILRKRRTGHTVLLYTVDQEQDPIIDASGAFYRGQYNRAHTSFAHGRIDYRMRTVFGLPQFDSLSYQTKLLFNFLGSLSPQPVGRRILVRHPGQGHVAVFLSKVLMPSSIDLIDRDLLALRCSARNIILNGYDPSRISTDHQVDVRLDGRQYDLIVAEMREDEGPEVNAIQVRQAVGRLALGGLMVVAANSSTITRLIKVCRAEQLATVIDRKRRRGSSLLVLSIGPQTPRR